jgi:hypothetical protein
MSALRREIAIVSHVKHRSDSILTSWYLIEDSLDNLEKLISYRLGIEPEKAQHDPLIQEIVEICHFDFPKI